MTPKRKKRSDRSRLNWLSRKPANAVMLLCNGFWIATWGGHGKEAEGKTPREAIDAAMDEAKKREKKR